MRVRTEPDEELCVQGRWWRERALVAEQQLAATCPQSAEPQQVPGSRSRVEQVIGVLTVVFGLDPDAAFEVVMWVSRAGDLTPDAVADQFLDHARTVVVGPRASKQVLAVLATVAGQPHVDLARASVRSAHHDPTVS